MIFPRNESLNTMEATKVTKIDNFVINSIINPILLTRLLLFKVFFSSPILKLKDSYNDHWSLILSTQTSLWPKHLNFTLWSFSHIINIFIHIIIQNTPINSLNSLKKLIYTTLRFFNNSPIRQNLDNIWFQATSTSNLYTSSNLS